MDIGERIAYVEMTFNYELERVGKVDAFPEVIWDDHILSNPDIDPNNVYKQYGIGTPHLFKEEWHLPICPEIVARTTVSDDELGRWTQYWCAYLGARLIVLAEMTLFTPSKAEESEIEFRVNDLLRSELPELFEFANNIKHRLITGN